MGDSQLAIALDVSSLVMSLMESAKQDWNRGSCLVRSALPPYAKGGAERRNQVAMADSAHQLTEY